MITEPTDQPNSKTSPQQAVTKFAILAFAIGYPRRYSQEKKLFERKSNLRSLSSPKNTFQKAWQTAKRELRNEIL